MNLFMNSGSKGSFQTALLKKCKVIKNICLQIRIEKGTEL